MVERLQDPHPELAVRKVIPNVSRLEHPWVLHDVLVIDVLLKQVGEKTGVAGENSVVEGREPV